MSCHTFQYDELCWIVSLDILVEVDIVVHRFPASEPAFHSEIIDNIDAVRTKIEIKVSPCIATMLATCVKK